MSRIVFLFRSHAPFPDERTQSSSARFAYHRFIGALEQVGFLVETATDWPSRLNGDTWLFVHMSPFQPDICGEVAARYGATAVAQAVAVQLRFPDGYKAVNGGAALSVGAEIYAAWLRGETPAVDNPAYLITSGARARALGAPIYDSRGEAVMLAGGMSLPDRIWQCLSGG